MDIREKIIQLLHDEYYDIDGLDCKQQWLAPIADQILSLIRQEIESVIPKELMDMEHTEGRTGHRTAYQVPYTEKTKGYNQALSDIRTALKKRGIL